MINIPQRIFNRLVTGIKKFQPILETARARDVNESDTVIIVTDILSEVLGFDKYTSITSEFSIKGTYCDLATKIDGKVNYLIEVKAVGLELKDNFAKQAVDYAANSGIDWVILTNGIAWKVFKVIFAKPIEQEIVFEFDFLSLSPKLSDSMEQLYYLTVEACSKSCLDDYHSQKQALSRFFIGALITSDPIIDLLRKELRKLSPDVKVENDQIKTVLLSEVLKREVVEGEKAEDAKKRIVKIQNKLTKAKAKAGAGKHLSAQKPESISAHEESSAQE